MSELIAVTGATGGMGGRVAARLADRGVAQRLIVRDAARAPRLPGAEITLAAGYRDRPAMAAALAGAATLFMVSGRESADRVAEHRSAIDAAVDAGVRRIVYLSFLGASPTATFTFVRDHHATEEIIRATGLAHTFVRNSLYADFVPGMVSAAGVLAGPGGRGRVAPVARDDSADAIAAVLTSPGHDGATYELTGPAALSLEEIAAELGRITGRSVVYHEESEAEAYAARASYGAPDFAVRGWVTNYQAIAAGELDVVTAAVQELAGHPPLTLAEVVAREPELVAHLR